MSPPTSPCNFNMTEHFNCFDSNTQAEQSAQYAKPISKRKDKAISAVESAHAERATTHALATKQRENNATNTMITAFEELIERLHSSEYSEWTSSNSRQYPSRLLYSGTHAAEANGLTMKVYSEKQDLIGAARNYIDSVKERESSIQDELVLAQEKSADFEEQLEASLAEQDDTDKLVDAKDGEIKELKLQIDKSYRVGFPFLFFAVFYSYLFGTFGALTVMYNHLWFIGMFFYTCGQLIQTFFEAGANGTNFIINTSHAVCTYLVPIPV